MFERRLRFVAVLGGVFFLVLLAKLFHMQVVRADHWRDEARRLGYRSVTLKARRGALLDRHGVVLAEDRLQWDLMVRFDHFDGSGFSCAECGRPFVRSDGKPPTRCPGCRGREFERGPDPDLARLASLLGIAPAELEAALAAAREDMAKRTEAELERRREAGMRAGKEQREEEEERFRGWWWTVRTGVPPEVVREVTVNAARWRGFGLESNWRRASLAGAAETILGSTGPVWEDEYGDYLARGYSRQQIWHMHVGRSGLEAAFEEDLAAREGQERVYRNAAGEKVVLPGGRPARDGETIRTSLDLSLQTRVAAALARAGEKTGARFGAFVAMDPGTGEVLVMASWSAKDEGYFWPIHSMVPGSTFKVVTAIAGLESGSLDPDEPFDCDGIYGNVRCHAGHACGRIDLRGALRASCNGYFARAAEEMGIAVLEDWAHRLGFEAPTGIELPDEHRGLVGDPEWKARQSARDAEHYPPGWFAGDTRQIGFGQGYLLVTPLQIARLMALVANGGREVRPTLRAGGAPAGEGILSARTLRIVREGLGLVVDSGTADDEGLGPFRTAGKTGTADVSFGNMAWFAGYAPREAPRFAFAAVLGGVKAYGAAAAGPVSVEFLSGAMSR